MSFSSGEILILLTDVSYLRASYILTNTAIPFDFILTNIGGGLNNTTGIFTVPTTGIYSFSASGWDSCRSILQVGGSNVGGAYGLCTSDTYAMQAVLSLKAGNQVTLVLSSGSVGASYVQFGGVQLA